MYFGAPRHEVAGEALGLEAERGIVAGELVGAGAGVVAGEPRPAPVAVLLVLLDQRLVHHVDLGHHGEEDRRGLGQRERDGVTVDGFRRARRHHGAEQRGRALLEGEDALHAVADVLGGDLGAVVELRAAPELERVGEPVGGDGVALGEPRLEHRGIVDPAVEAVVEVEPHRHAPDVERGVRVHRVVRALVGEDEASLRVRVARGADGGERHQRGRREGARPRTEEGAGSPHRSVGHVRPPGGFEPLDAGA